MDELAYKQFMKLEKNHWWFNGRRRVIFHLLKQYLPKSDDLKIMDVGCGYGGMLPGLSELGNVMGMEVDLDSAKSCKERGFHRICIGSGYTMPLKSRSLDIITLFDVIEHIEDDEKVVKQCASALKTGGRIMITVPAYQFLFANNDRIARHMRRYTLSRLKKIVKSAGLEVVKGTYYNVLLFPIILPAVLMLKVRQKLNGPLKPGQTGATNLSYKYPKFIKNTLEWIFSSERRILSKISSPFGHSIILIAKKNG